MSSRNPHIASCSKGHPECAECRRNRRKCSYTPKSTRTPLTRAHLTSVENRLINFETALQRLFPSGHIEQIVQNLVNNQSISENATNWQAIDSLMPEKPTNFPTGTPLVVPTGYTENPAKGYVVWDMSQISTANEDAYIQAYFLNYHPAHPFVHEASFHQEYRGHDTHDLGWRVLVNAVIALGSWTIGESHSQTSLQYYSRAEQLLQRISLMEQGSLSLIQALMLLHEYAQKQDSPQLGLRYLATGTRMALNLGFHKEESNTVVSIFQREVRRRVWWSIYVFDSCAAKSFGLPLLSPEKTFITAKRPLNIDDEMLGPLTTSVPCELDHATLYSGLTQQATFHSVANHVYRRVIANPNLSVSEAQNLEKMIDAWTDSCPPYLKASDAMEVPDWLQFSKDRLRICDKNLRILLWRPFLLKWTQREIRGDFSFNAESNLDKELAFRCLYAAKTSLGLIIETLGRNQHTKIAGSFLLYCLFHVILVFVVFLKSGASLPDYACFLDSVRTTRTTISQSWLRNDAQAMYFLNIIDRLCESLDKSSEQTN
ncbi:fungal-specific transcription factor domain-containing protein [Aspergillus pseudoustus]|uniref:Fungal-specific transcription factor domain-containing protein n=1 Tax=Aspergillus pseudoustus TaxID=1810923 RepID=A0ABR4JUK3_9EURO